MPIESKLKEAVYSDEYTGKKSSFEQRAENPEEKENNYFNQPCLEVAISDGNEANIKEIVDGMHKSIDGCGVGLAHNQYPKTDNGANPYAICIIECTNDNARFSTPFEALINPVIVGFSVAKVGFPHGCLSAIGHDRAKMASYKETIVASYDENFELKVKKYSDFAAVIVQHELNHLYSQGTYVDTVEKHKEENPDLSGKQFFFTEEELSTDPNRYELNEVGDDVPSLINNELLARCKNYLSTHKNYLKVTEDYYANHPLDASLYKNFMELPDTTVALYGECHHSE